MLILIDFHDTGRGPRIPAMTDRFGFTMASLNENGSVFANLCNEKNMSTLMYRPFKSWANNSEWSMRFEEEEVRAVVLGSSWVAAVTSLNFLRIFTEGGLQRHVVSLDGPVVTASGFGDELAVVTHSSPNLPSNEQHMLEFSVFNVPNGTETIRGRLPLTPGSFLTWFGFSEEGQLTSFDSMGFLRAFTKQYGGRWLPLFSASKLKKNEENYWMVGLNSSKLFCILCKSPDKFPQVYPSVVPDVCSEGPLILFGQYRGGFPETLKVRGVRADMSSFTIDLKVQRPKDIPLDKVLAKQQIEQYTTQAWFSQDKKLEEKVANLSMQMS